MVFLFIFRKFFSMKHHEYDWLLAYLATLPYNIFSTKDLSLALESEDEDLHIILDYFIENKILVQESKYGCLKHYSFATIQIRSQFANLAQESNDVNFLKWLNRLKDRTYAAECDKVAILENMVKSNVKIVSNFLNKTFADSGTRPLDEIIIEMTEALARFSNTSRVSIWKYETEKIVCLDLYVLETNTHSAGVELNRTDFLDYFIAIEKGEVIHAPDAQTDSSTNVFTEPYLKPLDIVSMLDVPFFVKGKMGGVICFENIKEHKEWSVNEINFAKSLCLTISLAYNTLLVNDMSHFLDHKNIELNTKVAELTEIKKKQEAFVSIIENSPDFISFSDREGKITYINSGGRKKLGIPDNEDLHISGLIDDETHEHLKFVFSDVYNHKVWEGEFKVRHLQTNEKHVFHHQIIRIDHPETKDFLCFVNIARNLDDRIAMEHSIREQNEELLQFTDEISTVNEYLEATQEKVEQLLTSERLAKEELSMEREALVKKQKELKDTLSELEKTQKQLVVNEKMASLGVLVAGIAHEINNPINYINASSEAFKGIVEDIILVVNAYNDLDENNVNKKLLEINNLKAKLGFEELLPEISELSSNILAGTEQVSEIVRGLRGFSRADSGKLEQIAIHNNLDTALLILQSQLKHNVVVNKEYKFLDNINVNASKINQLFVNIISNSIDAIREKFGNNGFGQLDILIDTFIDPLDKKHLQIIFEDNGVGIDKEHLEKIFDPFFTTKEVGKGTGLGMFIVMGIIDYHRGKITIDSIKNEGTKVTIFLPF